MLPVGHTHVDVDQMFSTISKKIKRKNIENIPDLLKNINAAFVSEKTKPKIRLIHQIWDIKQWISDFI